MTEWQPIETAPKDGTRILITDGKLFAAAYRAHYVEPQERHLGYDEGVISPEGWKRIGPRFLDLVPNPRAGERREWWQWDNPSAFLEQDETGIDHDGNIKHGEATHWMPLPEPPSEPSNA